MDKVLERLSHNIYITIDLDAFDPSIMPAVGTPEPGGLLWYQSLKLLNRVIDEKNVVGFDVVELCPIPGNIAPDFMAAKLVFKMLGRIFKKNNWIK
jgi:agmatinase